MAKSRLVMLMMYVTTPLGDKGVSHVAVTAELFSSTTRFCGSEGATMKRKRKRT